MNTPIDWKEQLAGAFNITQADNTEVASQQQQAEAETDPVKQQGRQMLDIVYERKGRRGKQATIVTGILCDDKALKTLASQLKQKLGVGGSARAGEILIQGDHREQLLALLQSMGFKARIV